jgi:hypothetical protein
MVVFLLNEQKAPQEFSCGAVDNKQVTLGQAFRATGAIRGSSAKVKPRNDVARMGWARRKA